jgi:hypothetical protein
MRKERAGPRLLREDEAIRRGRLLEFIVQQKQRGPSKGNITRAKTALSRTKVRTVRPTLSKSLHKS